MARTDHDTPALSVRDIPAQLSRANAQLARLGAELRLRYPDPPGPECGIIADSLRELALVLDGLKPTADAVTAVYWLGRADERAEAGERREGLRLVPGGF